MEATSLEAAPMKEISAEPSSPLPPILALRGPRAAFLSSSYTMNCIAPCDTCALFYLLLMLSSCCDQGCDEYARWHWHCLM